jgi:hypothetical protein
MILLDDEFIEAWKHGIVILCCDGIKRRFYPRIFVYSADYLEKWVTWRAGYSYHLLLILVCNRILIASIRNLGLCPCPRCLIPLNRVHNLGMTRDMSQRKTLARVDDIHRRSKIAAARRVIYEKNYQVNSTAVENLLRGESWVPSAVCS